MPDWITTTEAAELSGYHVEHIRRLIRQGRLPSEKKGRDWWVDKQELESFLQNVERENDHRWGPQKINESKNP